MAEQVEMGAVSDEVRGSKTDWRTGKPMVEHGDAFWQEHERRRVELGLSIPNYCSTHGLAISTFRHRVSGRRGGHGAREAPAAPAATAAPVSFVAVTRGQPAAGATVEIVAQGLTLRLCGEAAQQVLARVLERLA